MGSERHSSVRNDQIDMAGLSQWPLLGPGCGARGATRPDVRSMCSDQGTSMRITQFLVPFGRT